MSLGGNTAPQLGKDIGDRVFYFVFGDNVQAAAMAEYACDKGYKSAWMIGSEEIPYTKDIPRYFREAFEQCGGEIVGEDVYKIGQTEFRTQVTKIQNADPAPDVIFSPMFVPDSGVFLKALRGAGVDDAFLSTDGNDSTLFADSGGTRGQRSGLLDPRIPEAGNAAAGVPDRLRDRHGRSGRVEHVRGDRPRQRLRVRRGGEGDGLDGARRADHGIKALKDVPAAHGQHDDEPRHAHPDQGSHARGDGRHEAELCSRRARRSSFPSRDACRGSRPRRPRPPAST